MNLFMARLPSRSGVTCCVKEYDGRWVGAGPVVGSDNHWGSLAECAVDEDVPDVYGVLDLVARATRVVQPQLNSVSCVSTCYKEMRAILVYVDYNIFL
ncbi:hypothetical protein XENOCAPTIV_029505 [Xenoophorus captivus]|uniref:Uncharacterized protein n=1 Tax=Xenoophorus captivus TaxID=1517983 RepID=A0ABV0RVM7_9TELE